MEISFDKTIRNREYNDYLKKGMKLMYDLEYRKLDEYIKEIRLSSNDELKIIAGHKSFKSPRHGTKKYLIFYMEKRRYIKKRDSVVLLRENVMDFFFSKPENLNGGVFDNSDEAIAKKFNISRGLASKIVSKGLKEKFRLLNLKINSQ